jgi:hypothetical protein
MEEYLRQFRDMLLGRLQGPFSFRLVLQPLAAALIASRAGCRDARAGRPPYGRAVLTNPEDRHELLRQGSKELVRVFVMAVIVDMVYEAIVFHHIYPGQSLLVAALLALLPYPLFRDFANRIVRRCAPRSARRSGGLPTGGSSRRAW